MQLSSESEIMKNNRKEHAVFIPKFSYGFLLYLSLSVKICMKFNALCSTSYVLWCAISSHADDRFVCYTTAYLKQFG